MDGFAAQRVGDPDCMQEQEDFGDAGEEEEEATFDHAADSIYYAATSHGSNAGTVARDTPGTDRHTVDSTCYDEKTLYNLTAVPYSGADYPAKTATTVSASATAASFSRRFAG